MSYLGEGFQRTGRTELAHEAFERLVEEIALRYPTAHCSEIQRVLPTLVRTGRFRVAIGLVLSMSADPRYQAMMSEALGELIPELVGSDEAEAIHPLLYKIQTPEPLVKALCGLAVRENQSGRSELAEAILTDARSICEELDDPDLQIILRGRIAAAMGVLGRFEEAWAEADALPSQDVRQGALNALGDLAVQDGRFSVGLSRFSSSGVNELLGELVHWAPAFDKLQPGLTAQIVTDVLRLAGWCHPKWENVYRTVMG